MITLNLDTLFTDYDNEPVIFDGQDDPVKIKAILLFALNNVLPGETQTSQQKQTAFELSVRIAVGGYLELKADEAAFILERIGVVGSPLQLGRVKTLIDG